MKNRNGFTLTEILAVLGLMLLILLIVIPATLGVTNSIKSRELETKKTVLISSAEEYAKNNQSLFDETSIIKVPVRTLVYYGYSDKDVTNDSENCEEPIGCVINPVDDSSMNDDIITIKKIKSVIHATYEDLDIPNVIYATFHANGATITAAGNNYIKVSCEVNEGETCTLNNLPRIERNGYEVYGWNESPTATTGNLSQVSFSKNTDFYAITKKDVTVTFDPAGGTISGTNKKTCSYYNLENSCGVTAPSVTSSSGLDFLGWYRQSGDSIDFTNISNSFTAVAHWSTPKIYALVRRTQNLMDYSGKSVTTDRGATIANIPGGFELTSGTQKFGGVYLPTDIFVDGRTYIIKYKVQKVSGALYKIGGHIGSSTQVEFKINGTNSSLDYKDEGTSNSNVSNNNTEYNVYLKIKYKSGANIYIQPNRGRTDNVTVNITDLDVYEEFESSSKTYGSLFTSTDLASTTFGSRKIDEWYNNNSLETKLTTSTSFNGNSAVFDDVSSDGTKAYIYGKVTAVSGGGGSSSGSCDITIRITGLNATCNNGHYAASVSWCQCDFIHHVSNCVDHVDSCYAAANTVCANRGGVKSYSSGCSIKYYE